MIQSIIAETTSNLGIVCFVLTFQCTRYAMLTVQVIMIVLGHHPTIENRPGTTV